MALAVLTTRGGGPLRSFLIWSVPVLLPLLFIHAVCNPAFLVTKRLWDFLPFRADGFAHAMHTGSSLVCLLFAAVLWRYVDAPRLLDWLITLRLPVPALAMFAQSHSILLQLRQRAEKVLLAQQARGIAAGPSFLAKIRALPTVVLPVALSTLVEADTRAAVLASRGLGTGTMTVFSRPQPSSFEIALAAISVLGWALLLLL